MNAVVTTKDFEERLFEKIRSDIGSLMTDEQLKKLVETAMERTFFQDRVELDRYGSVNSRKPPHITELVKGLLATKVQEAVNEWLKEHPDEIRKVIEEALRGGMTDALTRAIRGLIDSTFAQMQYNLQQALEQALVRR